MIRWGLVAAIVSGVAGQVDAQTAVGKLAQANGWHTDYETARAAARQSGKPMMVVFRCEP
jgi:hypothetical protein